MTEALEKVWEGMVEVQGPGGAKAIKAGASTIFKIADVLYCLVLMPAIKTHQKFFVESSNTVALEEEIVPYL